MKSIQRKSTFRFISIAIVLAVMTANSASQDTLVRKMFITDTIDLGMQNVRYEQFSIAGQHGFQEQRDTTNVFEDVFGAPQNGITWFRDSLGNIKRLNLVFNDISGEYDIQWYSNGYKKKEKFMQQYGIGYWKSWHEKGSPALLMETKNNRPHGRLIHWDAQGEIIRFEKWHHGELIEVVTSD